MISVTNNMKGFFEEEASGVYIYGTGDYGKWVARFMQRCNMEFEGFIDRGKPEGRDCYVLGKPVMHPGALHLLIGTKIRIIIATLAANEILAELPWHTGSMDVLCMVPIYHDPVEGKSVYDINKLLSYFRAKLFKVEVPTIFSDRCTAGFIYRALGQTMISPAINTGLSLEDYLKICRNPKDYFLEDMVFGYWTIIREENKVVTRAVGRVKDIEVVFAHEDDGLQAIRRWNKMRKWINWNYLVFVLSDEMSMIPCRIAEEFCSMKDKHLLIMQNALYPNISLPGCMFVNHKHFHDRNRVIESWFDLMGWINGEVEI